MGRVLINNERYKPLEALDWDFMDSKLDDSANLHPYPARFISEIPYNLINTLGCRNGSNILDPFCGSGTTLYVAKQLGYDAIGIDLNPIACLISNVRTSKINGDFIKYSEDVYAKCIDYDNGKINLPNIPNLDHWFKSEVQIAIAILLNEINKINNKNISDALRLALSSIIVRVSLQESDTRYAAVDNSYNENDVYRLFLQACQKLAKTKEAEFNTDAKCSVLNKDVLKTNVDDIGKNVGLVITSPPYPNAYEYWLYHKYRMWWLGYDPISVRTYEIGARPHYQKKNGQTKEDFKNQMSCLFDLLYDVTLPDAHICFVIGRSIIKGELVDNAEIIRDVAEKHNLEFCADIKRNISSNKKSFNLKYGKIKEEDILIFRKD